MDEKQIGNLRRLAKSSVSEDGQVRPFAEQMRNYAFGNLPTNEFLIVTDDASKFHLAGVGNEAVLMSQKNIEKVRLDHSINLDSLMDLPSWLEEHPFSMDSISMKDALVVFAGATDVYDNEIIIALHLGRPKGQKNFELLVDEVSSVYGKENASFFIGNSARAGAKLYVNEKTKGWSSRAGVQFPELATSLVYNEYTLERIESQEQFDSVTDSKESVRAPETYKGLWWSPGERIAFYADPTGEKEPQTWQGVDAERLSAALAGEASPALVAQALGAPDYDGRPLSALKRVNDWESMPESHDELAEWKERIDERIDLSATQPEQYLSTEKTAHLEEKKLLTAEKKTLGEKVSGLFNRDKQTARQDESRAHSQARGDDGKRPTRAAEKDL